MQPSLPNLSHQQNMPTLEYRVGTPQRDLLQNTLTLMAFERPSVPLVIGDKQMTGNLTDIVMPHEHHHIVARASTAKPGQVTAAIDSALQTRQKWFDLDPSSKAAIFYKAAELLLSEFRIRFTAAHMLTQSHSAYETEFHTILQLCNHWKHLAEMIDRRSFEEIGWIEKYKHHKSLKNYRGFIYAYTPSNAPCILDNLPTKWVITGNTVIWKPGKQQLLTAYYIMQILEQAGLPPGVINLVYGDLSTINAKILSNDHLSAIHFSGHTTEYMQLMHNIFNSNRTYENLPEIFGKPKTSGYIFAHSSVEPESLIAALIRGAFAVQGQRDQNVARAYIPHGLWSVIKPQLLAAVESIGMGDIQSYDNFMGALIDRETFDKVVETIDRTIGCLDVQLLTGGTYEENTGWYVRPTIFEVPNDPLAIQNINGPVLCIHPYREDKLFETLRQELMASNTSRGCGLFGQDRQILSAIQTEIKNNSIHNIYINEEPCAANIRYKDEFNFSQKRIISECIIPRKEWLYPHMIMHDLTMFNHIDV